MTTQFAIAKDRKHADLLLFDSHQHPEIKPEWLKHDGLVFELSPGERPKVALDAILPLVDLMSRGMYERLSAIDDEMELAAARGEDATHGFYERWGALPDVLTAAPWTFEPDSGLVFKERVWEIVLNGFDGSDDATDDKVLWVATSSPDVVGAMKERAKNGEIARVLRTEIGTEADGIDLTAHTVEEFNEGIESLMRSSTSPSP
jgi:hypothetical protein